MKREELVKLLAKQNDIPQNRADREIRCLAALLRDNLFTHGEVSFLGLGKVKIVNRSARVARNPKTGEKINLPARRALKFLPARSVKEYLNQNNLEVNSNSRDA